MSKYVKDLNNRLHVITDLPAKKTWAQKQITEIRFHQHASDIRLTNQIS